MGVIQFEDWEDTGSEYIKFELGADAPSPGNEMRGTPAATGRLGPRQRGS